MTIYASYPSADQSWLIRGCANSLFSASTIYREIITSTSTSSGTKTASQANPATLSSPTATASVDTDDEGGGSGQITAPPTGLPAPTGTAQPATEGGSKAWIAGVVVGPILGLALIGLVAVWLMKRRKAANQNHNMVVAGDAKPDPSVADQSSMHPSVYYGAGSPPLMAPASPPIGKYYQGEPPSAVTSTPSPVNGYTNPQQGMYPQHAAYGVAPYPPQQHAQYPPQHAQPSQYSPQPYPAQFATAPPPMDRFPSPYNAAELASVPMNDAPHELGDGGPVRR